MLVVYTYYYCVRIGDSSFAVFFFFNDTATTEIYTLSLHDALPILGSSGFFCGMTLGKKIMR